MWDFIVFILIGLVAGWIAGNVVRGHGMGIWLNIAVGIVGALIGGYLFSLFGFGAGNFIGQIIMATIGAVILLLGLSTVKRRA